VKVMPIISSFDPSNHLFLSQARTRLQKFHYFLIFTNRAIISFLKVQRKMLTLAWLLKDINKVIYYNVMIMGI
jgi:hypothetical protein